MKSREIEQVDLSMEAMQALLEHAKPRLEESYYAVLEKVVKSTISMTALLENKDMTIEELRRLVFGPKSEKLKDIFGDTEEADESASDKADSPSSEVNEAQEAGEQPKKKRVLSATVYDVAGCDRLSSGQAYETEDLPWHDQTLRPRRPGSGACTAA